MLFNNSDHAAKSFGLAEAGFIYTRLNNPTNDILEQRLAKLEGGIGAVVTVFRNSSHLNCFIDVAKNWRPYRGF